MLHGLFNLDSPIMRFLGRCADLMILNLLFIVCSIPIFTIGASATALYYVCFKIRDQDEGYIVRNFFKSFVQNFKQATVIWLTMLLVIIVMIFELLIYRKMTDGGMTMSIIRGMIIAGIVLWAMFFIYVFSLQSKFYNTIRGTYRNAVLLAFGNAPRSFAMIGIAAGMIIFTIQSLNSPQLFWNLLLYWFLFGFSVDVFINSYFLWPVLKKLIPEEESPAITPDNKFLIDEETDLTEIGYGSERSGRIKAQDERLSSKTGGSAVSPNDTNDNTANAASNDTAANTTIGDT